MALVPGTRLGPYQIAAQIGAGGMGEVYRATDTKLGRDVAIKVLPSFFASDRDRLARFAREARLLAALNHPNIATIHGLEESGGVPALVMELVEGPTLGEKLAQGSRGPVKTGLALADALKIAAQIAEALEAAHEKGIVHRDLKPANLKLNHAGDVKVLDFGLAKAFSSDGSGSESQLPTIMASDLHAGAIVGTPAYMSPEQARGQVIDQRADIWAFGCVLFEMVTGRVAFSGETVSDTIAAVLERPPDWSALPAATPPKLRHVLARCLDKDPKRRWRDIGDVRIELDDVMGTPLPTEGAPHTASRGRERAAWALLLLATAAIAALLPPLFRRAPEAAEVRFDVVFPREVASDSAQLALSPDGQQIVAALTVGGGQPIPLWSRAFGSTSGRTLPGTEGAAFPFWSPDGRSIGFFADRKLKRLDVTSQAIEIVADAPVARGGAWQADDTILFAPNASGPLVRVAAAGGQPIVVTTLQAGQNDHRAPVILPDGQHFIYYARGSPQVRGVYVARLDGSESRRLLDADAAAVYASGHLLFVRQEVLFAQPFDATRLALNGEAFRLANRISVNPAVSLASLSASAAGPIAYSTASTGRTQFAWFDRSGKRLETVGPPDQASFANPSLSPDGRQVAFSRVVGGNWDIWLSDMAGAMSRVTSDLAFDFNPIWSPDGRQIFFQLGSSTIAARSVRDGAAEQELLKRPEMLYPSDVSPDGRVLLYTRATTLPTDLWYMSLVGDRTPQPFVETAFQERDGQFSPDGKWVAYQSTESGHNEIYLQPFPGPGDRIQVSAGGGQQVRWGRRSAELFYVAADQRLTSVPVRFKANGAVVLGAAVPLFRTEFQNNPQARQQYVVSPDGQRFLINASTDAIDPPSVTVILNWKGRP
jgi:Tol biopolymer transport system component